MWSLLLLAACSSAVPESSAGSLHLRGARAPGGGALELFVDEGVLVDAVSAEMDVVEAEGAYVVPALFDAHVHLSYWSVDRELRRAGVLTVVDLAAPIESLGAAWAVRVLGSGPMITAWQGYPTQSWGRDGYGLECVGAGACAAAVDTVADAGAVVIKVPLQGEPSLTREELEAIVERAHARGLPVAAHALGEAEARLAAEVGADLLAHTPVEALSDETVALWAEGAVVSSLMAFGNREATRDNLGRLAAAGATVLYGTDLGNRRVAGLDAAELAAMQQAGVSAEQVLSSVTTAPATFFGQSDRAGLSPGQEGSFVLLDADPLQDPSALARPVAVYERGQRVQ